MPIEILWRARLVFGVAAVNLVERCKQRRNLSRTIYFALGFWLCGRGRFGLFGGFFSPLLKPI